MSEQISLFEDEYLVLNAAVSALAALDIDGALTSLHRYRDIYHGNGRSEGLTKIALALQSGLSACGETDNGDRPGRLFAFWRDFEKSPEAGQAACASLMPQINHSFFRLLIRCCEAAGLPDSAFLDSRIPVGYAHIQTGSYDRAIASLQACIGSGGGSAAVYGYLADAYFLRGDPAAARQIYLEACLIDPCALDWDHLRDEELRQMRTELAEDVPREGGDDVLSLQWLPSHAYARGLFLPKRVRLRDEFGALVEQYLELRKRRLRVPSPELDARLFLTGIVLCDNEPFLRLIKGIDFAEVRREMKRAHPPLFAAYLKRIEKRAHRLI